MQPLSDPFDASVYDYAWRAGITVFILDVYSATTLQPFARPAFAMAGTVVVGSLLVPTMLVGAQAVRDRVRRDDNGVGRSD